MSGGWVAIPHAALAVAGKSPMRRLAVLDLWEQADRIGYLWMPWTERDLADQWGSSRGEVRQLVSALESAGCVEVERAPPGARVPSRMRVKRAVGTRNGPGSEPETTQSADQSPDQNGHSAGLSPRPDGGPERKPEPEPDSEPDSEPSRAEIFPRVQKTRQDKTREEEQLPKPPARRKSGKASGEAKPKRFDEAWLKLLADRWLKAWGGEKYPWDWFKDRETLTRCIAALDVQRNQQAPPEALDHLERAMSAYVAAARRDDPQCFPKGLPTLGGFAINLTKWLVSTEVTRVTGDLPKASIEARVRAELDAGASFHDLRERLKVTTKLKPEHVAHALVFLERIEQREAAK